MIKYLVTHPIQYQVPLIKYLSKKIKIKVAYRSNISTKKYHDKDFNKNVMIQKNLLNGYEYHFLKFIGPNKVSKIFPLTIEFKNIFSDNTKIIWVHGIKIWYNLIIIILSKFYKKKIFVRDEINILKKRSIFNYFVNKLFFNFIDNFIDCYLSIGSENSRALKSFGVNKKKIHLVPYVVNNDFFSVKKNITNKKLQILFTGKLIHRKGCDILLKSISLLNKDPNFKKNTEICIIGEGSLKGDLIEFKKKNNLTNVKFLGFKNQNSIKKYYKKADLMIIPSREENWGLAVNEAMASKNAIISSNAVGCVRDLIKNNHNGYIFKNDDYNDLAKKIRMIFDDKKKLIKFGNNSSEIISKWSFNECYIGLNNAIKFIRKK